MGTFTNYELWDTHTLLGVYREQEPATTFWLNLCFRNEITSTDEYIDFEKIPRVGRKLAPFVAPLAQGRPIYEEGARASRFKPAYIKPSDPITPTRVLKRRPGALLDASQDTPASRYDAVKSDIISYHRVAVERRHEWLAANAAIYGKVTIAGDDYPPVEIDFGRHADHSIVLGGGARWGDAGVSIWDSIESVSNMMHLREFAGRPNNLVLGVQAYAPFRTAMKPNGELWDLMRSDVRGSTLDLRRDRLGMDEITYIGNLGGNLDVWVYNDYYTVGGVVTPFMNAKDAVFVASGAINGYRCFGAIQDIYANFAAIPIYQRNYIQNGDVAIEQIMTQSAPLMVPVNPNATARMRVVA